jgi:hypothetical protein
VIWWLLLTAAAAVLVMYARARQNAIWGTATLAALIGVVVAFSQTGFDWWIVGKALVIGTFAGLAFEYLPKIACRFSRK